jgi:hypothetical protein
VSRRRGCDQGQRVDCVPVSVFIFFLFLFLFLIGISFLIVIPILLVIVIVILIVIVIVNLNPDHSPLFGSSASVVVMMPVIGSVVAA